MHERWACGAGVREGCGGGWSSGQLYGSVGGGGERVICLPPPPCPSIHDPQISRRAPLTLDSDSTCSTLAMACLCRDTAAGAAGCGTGPVCPFVKAEGAPVAPGGGGLVGWWVSGLVGWWVGGLVDWGCGARGRRVWPWVGRVVEWAGDGVLEGAWG